jgi:integrase
MSLQRNVVRRGATYYFRIAVPTDLVAIIGRKEVWRSLKTKDAGIARLRAAIAQFKILDQFGRLRGMAVFDRDEMARSLMAAVHGDPAIIDRRKQEADRRVAIETELEPEAIASLVHDYYQQQLREEEDWRIGDRPAVDLDIEKSFDWDFLTYYGETPDEVKAYCASHQVMMADLVRYEDSQQQLEHYQDRLNKGDWRAAEDVVEAFLCARGLADTISELDYRRLCHRLLHAYCDGLRARIAWFEGNWGFSPHSPYVRDAITHGARPAPSAPRLPSRIRVKGKGRIGEHAASYIDEKGVKDPKSRDEHEKTLQLLEDFHGQDKQIDTYTKDDIIAFKDALRLVPSNFKKFFPNATMKEAIEKNIEAKRKTLDAYTVQRKLDTVRRFFGWAVGNNLIGENPADNIKIAAIKKKSKKSDRQPFTIEELRALFKSPLFVGCRSYHRWKRPGALKIRDHRYWLPLLALWTGARQGELAQLLTGDIGTVDGTMVIRITETADDEAPADVVKKVKNASSIRIVPVHDQLRLLGFPKYVERMRREKRVRLFPECQRAKDESFSPFSKHFRNVLSACGIRRAGVVFHSFRHSFEDAMRAANLEGEVRHSLTGRGIEGSVGLYGNGYPISVLKEAMDKVRYEGLDLSHLYVEDQ